MMTPKSLYRFIVFTAICTVGLLVAGALVTSSDDGLAVPDWPLSYGPLLPPWIGGIRLVGAAAVVAMILWTTQAIARRHAAAPVLRRGARSLQALLAVQLLLGAATYWVLGTTRDAPQHQPLYVVTTVAHLVVGALTLAAAVLLSLACYRQIVPVRAVAGISPAAGCPVRPR